MSLFQLLFFKHLITCWLLFYISNEWFQLLTIFKCLNQAVADVGLSKFKQENQSKASEKNQTLLLLWLEMAKEGIVHIKTKQSNKKNSIQHITFCKYSDVTPFAIMNIFRGNCNLLTYLQTVTYSLTFIL